jgi:hypothetical protein
LEERDWEEARLERVAAMLKMTEAFSYANDSWEICLVVKASFLLPVLSHEALELKVARTKGMALEGLEIATLAIPIDQRPLGGGLWQSNPIQQSHVKHLDDNGSSWSIPLSRQMGLLDRLSL